MPKTNPIPQLSIVIPIDSDVAAFESTLISVLENQPSGSEIVVPHDGTYGDPFQIRDEVRFVESSSNRLNDLIGTASHQARGRFVHLLGNGLRATNGWTEHAIEAFNHFDTAAVAPVIYSASDQRVVSAGWKDSRQRLCLPHRDLKSVAEGIGSYLQASFWRRDVLRSLQGAFDGDNLLETSVVYHRLIRLAGWRAELAAGSEILCDSDRLPWDLTSFQRGMRLRAIKNYFNQSSRAQSFVTSTIAAIASAGNPSGYGESLGQFFAALATGISDEIHPEAVLGCDDQGMIVSMPQKGGRTTRRAA
ncbi:hypothetical protein OAH34_01445 [bacterium]|nr:hypothetical protein [Rhodopirellula sp.]MDB4809839.1 hypothetical protein [bacterium]